MAEFSSLRAENVRRGGKVWRQHTVQIYVPSYEARLVTIKLFPNKIIPPEVTTDGSKKSPHRYEDGCLCMWHPHDPKDMRWIFSDGLLKLLVMIQAHLFREAWWRENDEWLGPDVPHEAI